MKFIIHAKSNEEYIDNQTVNSTLPILVANQDLADIQTMSEDRVINTLDLEDVLGLATQETDYIKQLDEILGIEEEC